MAQKPIISLYGHFASAPTRSVLMLCQAAKIPYEFQVVNALRGDNRKIHFLAINPTGLIPAISDPAVGSLGESAAVLQYLAESRMLSSWYPTDAIGRARVNYWLHWNHNNTRVGTTGVLKGILNPDGADEYALQQSRKLFARSLRRIDEHCQALKPGTFIAGTLTPSIADLMLVPELDQHLQEAYDSFDFSPYPHLKDWLGQVTASVSSYDAVFRPLCNFAKKQKKL